VRTSIAVYLSKEEVTVGKLYGILLLLDYWRAYKSKMQGMPSYFEKMKVPGGGRQPSPPCSRSISNAPSLASIVPEVSANVSVTTYLRDTCFQIENF